MIKGMPAFLKIKKQEGFRTEAQKVTASLKNAVYAFLLRRSRSPIHPVQTSLFNQS
jgi:hypothetical protein